MILPFCKTKGSAGLTLLIYNDKLTVTLGAIVYLIVILMAIIYIYIYIYTHTHTHTLIL